MVHTHGAWINARWRLSLVLIFLAWDRVDFQGSFKGPAKLLHGPEKKFDATLKSKATQKFGLMVFDPPYGAAP